MNIYHVTWNQPDILGDAGPDLAAVVVAADVGGIADLLFSANDPVTIEATGPGRWRLLNLALTEFEGPRAVRLVGTAVPEELEARVLAWESI